ncbi:hypothetical protein [Aliiglaciecola litoralis]|uniref:Uncharacterized protein n=1 Tax=Aliiglaciecola litoralis TaxID=582857 RepID=A0ABN1LH70_9ALTE
MEIESGKSRIPQLIDVSVRIICVIIFCYASFELFLDLEQYFGVQSDVKPLLEVDQQGLYVNIIKWGIIALVCACIAAFGLPKREKFNH